MMEIPGLGLKLAAPKLVAGVFFGLPVTLVVGPVIGAATLAVLGAACVGGYIIATDVEAKKGLENPRAAAPAI